HMRDVLKLVRDLQRRKARERRSLVILEGWRLVEDAMGAGAKVVALLAAEGAEADALITRASAAGIDLQTVPRRDFDAVAGTETPGGVIAVAEWEPLTLETLPAPKGAAVALVLDAVQDPGNVGTMIRTAHALGAWCTIALDGTVDVRNPKVLRGAMGSHFRHPVATADFADLATFVRAGAIDVCLAATDGTPVGGAAPPPAAGRVALVVGSEGHGVRPAWTDLPHRRVSIPDAPGRGVAQCRRRRGHPPVRADACGSLIRG
ncbi:MAG: TrmH family RNA methyltransferase, partial [Gemmatimonadales bacterium]